MPYFGIPIRNGLSLGLGAVASLSTDFALRPSLDLIFAGANALDSQVTFSRASTATYFDSAGVLQSAANNVPRFDYNPATLAARGLLIEEQRTNNWVQSGDISNASWIKIRSSTPGTTTTSPSGGLAQKLVEDTSNGSHFIRQDVSVTSGVTYTQSVFVKAAERSQIQLAFDTDNGAFTYSAVIFTLSGSGSGTIIGGSPTFSITLINNGWYRCTITQAAAATATGIFRISLADGGTAFYTGDGTSGLFIWGAQLEAGAFPTSYIPTTTTALTRAADVASVNTLSPWFNATEGTLFAEAASTGYVLDTNFPLVASIDDGTNNNRITINQGSASTGLNTIVRSGGVGTTIADSGVDLSAAVRKIAGAVLGSNVFVSVNGGSTITGTTNGVPSGLTTMRLGSSGGLYLSALNGHLRRITYYPRRLSNAELQAITA